MHSPYVSSIDRRKLFALVGGGAAVALVHSNATENVNAATCSPATPTVTEGPYWVDEKLFRSDIRTDPATGVARPGVPLTLTISVQNLSSGSCVPLTGALIDIWHCDASGIYSDEPSYNPGGGTGNVVTTGQKFLRGYQISDDNGQVTFTTIFPGWYTGRTIHIHFRVRTWNGATKLGDFVSQIFFDEAVNNTVLALSDYKRTTARTTTNSNDNVYSGAANAARMLATIAPSGSGYAATISVGVSLATARATAPRITSGGISSAASGVAGVTPAGWFAIYGTNLAAATRLLAASDVVDGKLPTSLGGVSVQVNGKAACILYTSPGQINALAPADTATGAVDVTVSNAAGTSSGASTTLQFALPGIFTASGYVRAVRVSDGAVVNGTGASEAPYTAAATAKAGDVLELFGTGFGPTTPSVEPGLVFTGAYPTTNAVGVTIGGVSAPVSFAGLVGAGLYQINVTVPAGLTSGDQPVVATVAGISSPSSALLKLLSSAG